MSKDANDIHRDEGIEALCEKLETTKRENINTPKHTNSKSRPTLVHDADAEDKPVQVHGITDDEMEEVLPPEFSEIGLAEEFVEKFKDRLRYVDLWRKWLVWDGVHWKVENTRLFFDYARKICTAASMRLLQDDKRKEATKVANARTIAAVAQIASADRQIASVSEQWDINPWLLNTPDGTIDLRTGKKKPNNSNDHITKMTAVAPYDLEDVAPEDRCPKFLKFLDEITGGDEELQKYLQQISGYSLTGSTKEQCLFFWHGEGANGKSVLINTLAGIFSDYATSAPMETFTVSRMERHPTELAHMRGARLVTSVETEEGREWAEARIKALTGGDTIVARFMRGDFFEFKPNFKLVIAGNHMPKLKVVDEAIRRRFRLVPFTVTIPEDKRNPDLEEELKAEWPGILSWCIDGAREWFDHGSLDTPQSVTDATEAYFNSQDHMALWLEECCDVDAQYSDTPTALYESWVDWAGRSNLKLGSQTAFSLKLKKKFDSGKEGGRRCFEGLRVKGLNSY